jgi:putative transposase
MSPSERKAMINRDRTGLSLTSQCKLLKISRSSLYYVPVGVNAGTLELMNEIDRVFTKHTLFLCPAGHCAAMAREGAGTRLQPTCRKMGFISDDIGFVV